MLFIKGVSLFVILGYRYGQERNNKRTKKIQLWSPIWELAMGLL